MQRQAYDTKEGIQRLITTLDGLNRLVEARRKAGYQDGERMNTFYILGRWSTDACGNFGKISGEFVPKEHFPEIPDVLEPEEFFDYLQSQGYDKEEIFINVAIAKSDVPPVGLLCPVCRKSWTIENCHDTVVVHDTEVFPLAEFEGRQLWEVQRAYANRDDATYRMQNDIMIRNDRFIDLRSDPNFDTLKVNERGWVKKSDGITGDYVIQSGDEAFFNVWKFFHKTCSGIKVANDEEEHFRDVFTRAGFNEVTIEAIPNQYTQHERSAPWFRVRTPHGNFTIGWRYRVINLDWDETGKDFLPLFVEENVTKGTSYIHAWSADKAVEYLGKIRQELALAA